MKIFSLYLLGEPDDLVDKLNDSRTKIKYPYIFCLEKDKVELEEKYSIRFSDGYSSLFDLLLENVDIYTYGLDMMLEDDLRIFNNEFLFNNNFNRWLDKVKGLFLETIEYFHNNFSECKEGYIEQIKLIG
jgi:hypothetical protein